VKLRCPDCGGETAREDTDFSCAGCGSRRVEIVEGRDLLVETVDLET
jgi:Zn finger protein HypA/HybF involved in hydrogenase expression